MRSLEMPQKTADFRRRGNRVVGLASQKVAEKRYAPVRKVCPYIMGPMRSIAARQHCGFRQHFQRSILGRVGWRNMLPFA